MVIVSVIPFTMFARSSSATPNASSNGRSGTNSMSFWLSITTAVSTFSCKRAKPAFALSIRVLSRLKGIVMTPTTIASLFLAISATTGALPVPVPPPIPAAMNTKSASRKSSVSCPVDSSAAARPTCG